MSFLGSPAACSVVLHFNEIGQEENFVREANAWDLGLPPPLLYLILRTSFLREAEKEQIWQNRSNLLSKASFNSFKETRTGGLHLLVGSQAAGVPDQKISKEQQVL